MAKKKSAKDKPGSRTPRKKVATKKPGSRMKRTEGASVHPKEESRDRSPSEEAELAALRRSLVEQMQQLADSDLEMRFDMLITAVRADATEEAKRIFEAGGIDLNARYDLDDPSFLQRAAERGNLELVQYFVERGADVNDERAYGAALSCAAGKGHMHVYEFLEPLTDPKRREVAARRLSDSQRPRSDAQSVDALLDASMQGDLPSVRRLIKAGVDPNASNKRSHGAGPLASASHAGHKDVVDVLFKAGADPNKRAYDGKTPLMGVANADVCRALLQAEADVHATDDLGRSVLAWVRNAECCRLLLQAGADARAVTQDGLSVLYHVIWWRTQYRAKPTDAYDSNLAEIVRLLVEAGADVNHRPSNTKISEGTPLMHVASLGLCRTAQVLLDAGADVRAKGWKGRTALEYAKGHPEMQQLLGRAWDADPNQVALLEAAKAGRADEIRALLERGVDPNEERPIDEGVRVTPLFLAAEGGHVEAVKILLEKGANPDGARATIREEKGPVLKHLQAAPEQGVEGVFKMIENAKCWREIMRGEDLAPLTKAVENGHFEVVKAFTEFGASVLFYTEEWGSLQTLAEKKGYSEIAVYLREPVIDQAIAELEDRANPFATTAMENLRLNGRFAERAAPALLPWLQSSHEPTRSSAVRAIKEIAPDAARQAGVD